MRKNIMEMETQMNEDSTGLKTNLKFDGVHGDILKGAAMGVAEMIRMMNQESNDSKGELYNLFNEFVIRDLFEDVR